MCLTAPNTSTYNLKIVGVYTPEEEEIDQASLMENTFKATDWDRYYPVQEYWYKPDGLGNATKTWEKNIDMNRYIFIKQRTPKTLVVLKPQPEEAGGGVCKIRSKIYTADDGTEYIGDINSPYLYYLGDFRADHLIKGENIHLFKGCVINTDGEYQYTN